jgi:ABC-2 type transport system permease protein
VTQANPTSRDMTLLSFQIGLEEKLLLRNRRSIIFTFLLPVAFLIFIGASNQSAHLGILGHEAFDVFFVPGILAFGIVSATYANLAMIIAVQREQGVLKRIRGTPLAPWIFFGGKIGSSLLNALAMVIVVLTVGRFGYQVHVRVATLPGLILDLLVGTACWCMLGIAMSCFVNRAQGGAPIVTFPYIVLSFVSGVFYPAQTEPQWLQDLARAFPLEPFARSMEAAFDPRVSGPGLRGLDLVIMAAWFLIGLGVALRFFQWEPKKS